MGAPALSVSGLSVAYDGLPVLTDVSFEVGRGKCFGLVGESGCGKSTVAFAALRALPPAGRVTGGVVRIAGQDVGGLGRRGLRALWAGRVSMVYQDPGRALNPTLTVGAQVREAFAVLGARDTRARAAAVLGQVRIARPGRLMALYPHQLSGGMQQRVVIAMALAKDPPLLMLDEPTTGLDATVEAEILDLIDALRRERGTAVLLISHNLAVMARMCDRIGVLYAGRLVEQGPAAGVLGRSRHPYTARLVACRPVPGRRREDGPLPTIAGQPPAPGSAGTACVFAPRCDRAEAVCRTTTPPARRTGSAAAPHVALCHFEPPFPAGAGQEVFAHGRALAGGAAVLQARDLAKTFGGPGGTLLAVAGVDLSLAEGETLGLIGESGSGKTTLGRLILGLAAPDQGGQVLLDGSVLGATVGARGQAQRRAIQAIFQNPDRALNRAHRIGHILARPLARLAGLSGRARAAAVDALAASVRLGRSQLALRPRALSGGMKQRVAIASAFAGGPRVVVCDEPTSALDASIQAAILNLLVALQRRDGVAYLFISHDLAVVRYLADRIGVMYRGQLVEIGPAEAVMLGPHHPYTDALVRAATGAPAVRPERGAAGAGETQAGCVFKLECARYLGSVCDTVLPPFDSHGGHGVRCHITRTALPSLGPAHAV